MIIDRTRGARKDFLGKVIGSIGVVCIMFAVAITSPQPIWLIIFSVVSAAVIFSVWRQG